MPLPTACLPPHRLAARLASCLAIWLAGCSSLSQPPLLTRVEDRDARPPRAPIVVAVPKPAVSSAGTVVASPAPAAASPAAPDGPAAASGAEASVIYFGSDRYQVEEQYLPVLQAHAQRLKADPDLVLRIDAFTDDIGPSDYNLELSRMRAVMVQRQLRSLGVPAKQLQVVAHGPQRVSGGVGGSGTRGLAAARRVELSYR